MQGLCCEKIATPIDIDINSPIATDIENFPYSCRDLKDTIYVIHIYMMIQICTYLYIHVRVGFVCNIIYFRNFCESDS
jgi:hypothetical protein